MTFLDPSLTGRQREETGAPIGRAFLQLHVPDPANPIMALNVRPSFAPKFHVPFSLRSKLHTNHENTQFDCNITPKYSFVDIHIDRGTDGISHAMHGCSKFFFLYPPTSNNLEHYKALINHDCIISRANFEHGIAAYVDHASAIYLPAGWLHATVTLSGGFLTGITFLAAESIHITSACFAIEIATRPAEFGQNSDLYLTALSLALQSNQDVVQQDAIREWIALRGKLMVLFVEHKKDKTQKSKDKEKTTKNLKAFEKNVSDLWFAWLEEKGNCLQSCSCGWEGGFFVDHFLEEHLQPLNKPCVVERESLSLDRNMV